MALQHQQNSLGSATAFLKSLCCYQRQKCPNPLASTAPAHIAKVLNPILNHLKFSHHLDSSVHLTDIQLSTYYLAGPEWTRNMQSPWHPRGHPLGQTHLAAEDWNTQSAVGTEVSV